MKKLQEYVFEMGDYVHIPISELTVEDILAIENNPLIENTEMYEDLIWGIDMLEVKFIDFLPVCLN